MNILDYIAIGLVLILLVGAGIASIRNKKKVEKQFVIIDKYVVEEGTPVYFRSFRHVTLYFGRMKNDKAINLYLSEDGRFLETVAKTLLDKELTVLDKDVLVVRIEDTENYKQLISFDIAALPKEKVTFLEQVEIGDAVDLGNLIENVNDTFATYSRVLVNEKSIL